jgi:hypothetical protein
MQDEALPPLEVFPCQGKGVSAEQGAGAEWNTSDSNRQVRQCDFLA